MDFKNHRMDKQPPQGLFFFDIEVIDMCCFLPPEREK